MRFVSILAAQRAAKKFDAEYGPYRYRIEPEGEGSLAGYIVRVHSAKGTFLTII